MPPPTPDDDERRPVNKKEEKTVLYTRVLSELWSNAAICCSWPHIFVVNNIDCEVLVLDARQGLSSLHQRHTYTMFPWADVRSCVVYAVCANDEMYSTQLFVSALVVTGCNARPPFRAYEVSTEISYGAQHCTLEVDARVNVIRFVDRTRRVVACMTL